MRYRILCWHRSQKRSKRPTAAHKYGLVHRRVIQMSNTAKQLMRRVDIDENYELRDPADDPDCALRLRLCLLWAFKNNLIKGRVKRKSKVRDGKLMVQLKH